MNNRAKLLLARALRRFGVELVRHPAPYPRPEPWFLHAAWGGESVDGRFWVSNVWRMANRRHRPASGYRRPAWGEELRLKYICDLLDVRDQRVLELGPFEGYFSVLLEKLGVRENVAIESSCENHQKCLAVQSDFGLTRTRFVHRDLEDLAAAKTPPELGGGFDLVLSLGVLYHLAEPARHLDWCRRMAPRLLLGTHYVEPAALERYKPELFAGSAETQFKGESYRGWAAKPRDAPGSGRAEVGFWPYEDDLVRMLRDAGFGNVEIAGKELFNNTPHLTILAEDG